LLFAPGRVSMRCCKCLPGFVPPSTQPSAGWNPATSVRWCYCWYCCCTGTNCCVGEAWDAASSDWNRHGLRPLFSPRVVGENGGNATCFAAVVTSVTTAAMRLRFRFRFRVPCRRLLLFGMLDSGCSCGRDDRETERIFAWVSPSLRKMQAFRRDPWFAVVRSGAHEEDAVRSDDHNIFPLRSWREREPRIFRDPCGSCCR